MAAKLKVSVTIDQRVLREAERLAGDTTRSQLIERALAAWVRGRARAALDASIEAYYRTRTDDDARDDADWAAAGDEAVRTRWSR